MSSFAIARPESFAQAAEVMRDGRFSLPVIKAGGLDVVDHLKEGLVAPDALVDVKPLGGGRVERRDGRLAMDAGTTLANLGDAALVRENAPVLAQACGSAATPQVRNVASAAGNLLQRPRCWYYRNATFDCLKKGGATCYAVDGENAYHAIFGGGPCHIVHPSNLAVALSVLDGAVAVVDGTGAERRVPIAELYHLPDRGVRDEHDLAADEVVTEITCAMAPASAFYAVKHKQSFDWPLVMAAVALELEKGAIRSARVCAGAVAPIPWPLPAVEEALAGVRIDDDEALRGACARAAEGARPMRDNAYKVKLLPVAVRRAVLRAAGKDVP